MTPFNYEAWCILGKDISHLFICSEEKNKEIFQVRELFWENEKVFHIICLVTFYGNIHSVTICFDKSTGEEKWAIPDMKAKLYFK